LYFVGGEEETTRYYAYECHPSPIV